MHRSELSRHKITGVAAVSCFLALLLLCLFAFSSPAPPILATRNPAQSDFHRLGQRSAHVHAWVQARQALPYVNGDALDPRQYLPLVFKDYYRLPPWSGTARFGFGVAVNPVEEYDVSLLGAQWYNNFRFRSDPPPLCDLEYVQVIRLSGSGYSPGQKAIETYALARPGTLWLIGNEPDAPLQDCITPEQYAPLYHELYGIIKGVDPSAKVAIGGVVQATPLRLQYLDMILDEYQSLYGEKIPVDVWNVHGFVLQEKRDSWGCQIPCGIDDIDEGMLYGVDDHDNMAIFNKQIRDFRKWMKNHGERDKPLIVSEYGILFPSSMGFDEPRVESFMLATFDYFLDTKVGWLGYPDDENRLVQAWSWYSLDDDSFEGHDTHSHLFDPDTRQITSLGTAYRNYTSSLP